MRFVVSLFSFSIILLGVCAGGSAQPPPREIAGYRLGTNIKTYEGRIASEGVFTVRLRPYLKEAAVSVPEGFVSGYVVYGACDAPGTIVRVKVKYEDDRRAFFDGLLEALKKQYGAPSQYVGDPFQAYVAWKWAFDVSKDEKISMILSHYDGDDEEHTQGNALKLSLNSQIARESRCYESQRRHEQLGDRKEELKAPSIDPQADTATWRRWVPAP